MTRWRFRTRLWTAVTTTGLLLALAPGLAAAAPPGAADPADPTVRRDPATGHARMIFNSGGYLTPPSKQAPEHVALAYVRDHRGEFGLTAEQAEALVVVSSYPTEHNGARQVTIGQSIDGMRVHGALLTATVDKRGRLVILGGAVVTAEPAGTVELTAKQALDQAAEAQGAEPQHTPAGTDNRDKGRQKFKNVYAKRLTKPNDVTAELVWFPTDSGRELRPAWLTDIEVSGTSWYETVVDAADGRVLSRQSRYHHAGPEGTVFTAQHPDISGATRTVTPFTGRDGSWVADRLTQGNNANAYRDEDGDNLVPDTGNDALRPQSPASGDPNHQHFDYTFNDTWRTNASATQANLDADVNPVITQLFYYTNVMHDYLYDLGFDEASRNFQVNNFGRGGSGNDPVLAEAQDGWDLGCLDDATPPNKIRCTNNANFGTPGDGSSPRMQMYMWQPPGRPYRDGSLDGDVIAHEYGHGVSSRLVGGGNLGDGSQTGALGEGWSDTISFLKWGDATVGEYVTGNTATGIRSQAYDTSTEKWGTFNPARGVHRNGEIWAATMYDIREAKGVEFTQQLVIDGMKSTVTTPSYLDARDGILAADMAGNAGADQCLLWRVFAGRGMGANAASSADQNTVTADETVPAACLPTAKAGGPYTTNEGTDVTLSAAGSAKGTAPSAGNLTSYAWDLDNDGQYDDATGVTTAFSAVGQDGVSTVGLKVTDAAGNTDTDSTTVTVANAAPVVTLQPVTPAGENGPITLTGEISDPGWLDPLTATVDWKDGAGPQELTGTTENDRPDATLSFTAEHTYGDDGTFPIEVCGRDDDTGTCRTVDATIANIDPTAAISGDGQTTYNGQKAFIAHAGTPVAVTGASADPGSDDLTLKWLWGDGTSDDLVSLVNPPATDPDPSPSIQPRDVTATKSHAYPAACLSTLTFTSTDDDGGSASDTASVITTGNTKWAHNQAYWMKEFGGPSPKHFTAAQRACLLGVASFMSAVYGPLTDAQAYAILSSGSPQPRPLISQQLLAAWLNFANGSYDLSTPVDTDGDRKTDSTFGAAVANAEAVYNNPASTRDQLLKQVDVLLRFNVRDGG
ncbi:M36 family metallopeptidase [Streptomyces sp. NBC_01343]|uniref:M36 family metallopeptidase n=1 Tax=Streptomyces sp. NBC_01343 TaxID=2903832 RepID=UPI002E11CDB6|nr:M36 family metallopeptidase [Streptomyces sp. NBC_01343]